MNTSFNIEILFLWQEVGIRFQPLSNESSIKCGVEIHKWWKLWLHFVIIIIIIIIIIAIHNFAYGWEIPLSATEQTYDMHELW